MFCPNCGSHLSCDCRTCKGTNNVAIKLFREKLYKCPLCEKKFSEGESLDYEWDRMIEGWAKVATRSHCLEWLDNKRKIEEGLDFSEVTMRHVFFYHFKMNPYDIKDVKSFKRSQKLIYLLN